jgi:hypothetical protein
MKTAISIPDDVFCEAETFAHQRRLSRSALCTRALVEFLSRHRNEGVTERLNRLYDKEGAHLDASLKKMQDAVISKETW